MMAIGEKGDIFKDDIEYFLSMDWRKVACLVFIAVQLGLVIWARFIPERWFCWSPHDTQAEYELTVFVNGRELGEEEIFARYHRQKRDRDPRSAGNVKDIIRQQSQTYGKDEHIKVIMNHSINGVPKEPWIWERRP